MLIERGREKPKREKGRRQKEELYFGVSGRKNWATEHYPGRTEKGKKDKTVLEIRRKK